MEFDTPSEQVANFGDAVDVATPSADDAAVAAAVVVDDAAAAAAVVEDEEEVDANTSASASTSTTSSGGESPTSSSSEEIEPEEKPISVSQLKKYLKEKYNVDLTHAQFDVDAEGRNVLYVPSKADYKASGLPDPMPCEDVIATVIENEGVYIERAPANEDDIPEKLLVAGEKAAEEDGADLAEFIVGDDVVETLPSSASKKRKNDMESRDSSEDSSTLLPDGIDPANIIEVLPTRSCVAKAHKRIKYMIEYLEKGKKVVVPPEDAALVCSDLAATVAQGEDAIAGEEVLEGEDVEEDEEEEDGEEEGKSIAGEEMGDEDADWVPMEESEEDEESPSTAMDVDGEGPQNMDEEEDEEEEEEEEAMETDEDD